MTTAVVLSVSERAQLPSVLTPGSTYYITVPGDHCHSGQDGDCGWEHCPQLRDDEPHASGRSCPIATWGDEEEPLKLFEPQRWAVVSGDCPTCQGRGWDLIKPLTGDTATLCPDCGGLGWERVTLQATCLPCDGNGFHVSTDGREYECGDCDESGFVELGSVCVSLLPVVADEQQPHPDRFVLSPGNGVVALFGQGSPVRLDLDPAPLVGSWVVALEVRP